MPDSSAKIRILLAEDDDNARSLLVELLAALGHVVVAEVSNGREAIERARELAPDVVLLDVRLPDMSGFDVADRLAASGCTSALVVTSSSDDPLYPERAASCGARGFVAKHDVCGPALDRLLGSPA